MKFFQIMTESEKHLFRLSATSSSTNRFVMSKYDVFNIIYKNIFLKTDFKRKVWLILDFTSVFLCSYLYLSFSVHKTLNILSACIQSLCTLCLHLVLVNCKSQAHPARQSHRLQGPQTHLRCARATLPPHRTSILPLYQEHRLQM